MSRLTRDGAAEPVSRDQNLRRERVQGDFHFPCSADHEEDWNPLPGWSLLLLYVITKDVHYWLKVMLSK